MKSKFAKSQQDRSQLEHRGETADEMKVTWDDQYVQLNRFLSYWKRSVINFQLVNLTPLENVFFFLITTRSFKFISAVEAGIYDHFHRISWKYMLVFESSSNNWHTITYTLMFLNSQKIQNSLAKTQEKWINYAWVCVFPEVCRLHLSLTLIISNG